jgi:peptidoglycan/xylan/chitin deacetylase (PgdA/CDA1 family)
VALTFDDGPDPVYTRKILAILGQHHVKATFFLLGEKIKRYPDVVREIVQAGHAVGGHTYDHPDLRKLTLENAGSEIAKTQAQFRSAVGFEPDFFRPPFGAVTEDEIAHFGEMGFKLIDWSIDSFDWDLKHNSVAEILGKINAYKHPGAIVLMHAAGPHHQHTVDALPLIIADLEKDGYHFLTVPELLHIQAAFTDTQPRASNEPRQ